MRHWSPFLLTDGLELKKTITVIKFNEAITITSGRTIKRELEHLVEVRPTQMKSINCSKYFSINRCKKYHRIRTLTIAITKTCSYFISFQLEKMDNGSKEDTDTIGGRLTHGFEHDVF